MAIDQLDEFVKSKLSSLEARFDDQIKVGWTISRSLFCLLFNQLLIRQFTQIRESAEEDIVHQLGNSILAIQQTLHDMR